MFMTNYLLNFTSADFFFASSPVNLPPTQTEKEGERETSNLLITAYALYILVIYFLSQANSYRYVNIPALKSFEVQLEYH